MHAYEFHTTAQNGMIRIPDEYAKKLGSNIRVILFTDDQPKHNKKSMSDLIGILKGSGDIDLDEIRTERLHKYENLD